MSWDIEAIINELKATIADAIPAFTSVDEPGESLPPSGPFCLVEHIGGPVSSRQSGGLDARLPDHRGGESKPDDRSGARRRSADTPSQIIEALRGNIVVADARS
jgi:hypothetical protein